MSKPKATQRRRYKNPIPKRVRPTLLSDEQKEFLAQRKWVALLESMTEYKTYKVPLTNSYDRGIIDSTANDINKSKRKAKEFDVFDPIPDYFVYVKCRPASKEKIRESKKKKPNFFSRRSDLFRRHRWMALLEMLGPGAHAFHIDDFDTVHKLQRWCWTANSRGRFDKTFSTAINYKKRSVRVTVTPIVKTADDEKKETVAE